MALTRLYWVLLAIAIFAILMASFVLRKAVVEPKNAASAATKPPAAADLVSPSSTGEGLKSLLYRAASAPVAGESGLSAPPLLDPILQRELENWRRQEAARLLTIQANVSSESPRIRSFLLARSRAERKFLARSVLDGNLPGPERVIAILGLAMTDLAEHTADFIHIAKSPWLPEMAEEALTVERLIRVYAIRALQRHQGAAPDAAVALAEMVRDFTDPVLKQALETSAPTAIGFPASYALPQTPAAKRAAEVSTANDQADFSEAKEEN